VSVVELAGAGCDCDCVDFERAAAVWLTGWAGVALAIALSIWSPPQCISSIRHAFAVLP
jgi:hypothetical protein